MTIVSLALAEPATWQGPEPRTVVWLDDPDLWPEDIVVLNRLRAVYVAGSTVTGEDILVATRRGNGSTPGDDKRRDITRRLREAGYLEMFNTPGGGKAHRLCPRAFSDLGVFPTSEKNLGAINNYPEGVVVLDTSTTDEKPAAKPHRSAPPTMAPAVPRGETPGQKPVVHSGDNPGENRRRRWRTGWSSWGQKVVDEVARRGPYLPVKPKRGRSIGFTVKMLVEEFDHTPEAAVELLVLRSLEHKTIRKAAVHEDLTTPQQEIPVLTQTDPLGGHAPAPVDVVDLTASLELLETRMTQARVPEPVQAGLRVLVMERTELMRYRSLVSMFLMEVEAEGQTLTAGQMRQVGLLLAAEPGWDLTRIRPAIRTVLGV